MILVALLPIAGCITPGQIPTEPQPLPEVVVERFIEALADKDWSKALLLTDAGQAQDASGSVKNREATLVDLSKKWTRESSSARVMGVKINGHSAVVAVMRMTASGQFTSDLTPVYLHETNDLWRIASQVTAPDPDMTNADALEKWYAGQEAALATDISEPQ